MQLSAMEMKKNYAATLTTILIKLWMFLVELQLQIEAKILAKPFNLFQPNNGKVI